MSSEPALDRHAPSTSPAGGDPAPGRDADAETAPGPRPLVVIDDVHVSYSVYEDVRPTLRRLVARRFQPRPSTRVEALKGVSLTAYAGEVVGVIGRNGSGKSTLLRALTGLLPTDRGSVYASSLPVLLAVGAAMRGDLSGRRNVHIGGTVLGLRQSEVEQRFDELVEFAGLGHAIDRPLRTYSSGMGARLQFAIASMVAPEILLIDEALAVGDEEFRAKSGKRIRELTEEAGLVFLVSHGMESVRAMCTRAIWLDEGRLMADGDVNEVIAAYREAASGS